MQEEATPWAGWAWPACNADSLFEIAVTDLADCGAPALTLARPSNHARSLNPGVDRLAFSVVWDMDEEGNIQ